MLKRIIFLIILLITVYHVSTAEIINTKRISRQKCQEYGQVVTSCDSGDGSVVKPGQFPHMVSLGYAKENETYWMCSGVLISEHYILTTGHCGRSRRNGQTVLARFGVLQRNETKNETHIQQIKIWQILEHPDYKSPQKYNDISLLKLEHPVKINEYVRPACLPEFNQNQEKYIITGWETLGRQPKTYLTTYSNIYEVSNRECNEFYRNGNRRLSHGIDINTHFCASPSDIVCKMIAGSPLQTLDKNISCMFNIHAIASFGKNCLNRAPTVFTKIVSSYIDWIEKIVWS